MTYSLVGFIAIFIHLIVNFDVFLDAKKRKRFLGEKYYLLFLLSVIIFHITDGCWGIIYDNGLVTELKIDTNFYFIAMAASILFWGIFVYRYLDVKRTKYVMFVGAFIFVAQMILIIINFFYPVLFTITDDCVYSATSGRYAMLTIQILMYLLLSIYVFVTSRKRKESSKRRHITIGIFGLFMIASITLQVLFPLYPLYSLGFLFGVTALHTFVVEDERTLQKIELEKTKIKVLVDPLTGALSKHAFIDYEVEIDEKINDGTIEDFALVVFDLNDLKITNDTFGHEIGDEYLKLSAKAIFEHFGSAPIYRVGGDEFVAILMGDLFENRKQLFDGFNLFIDDNVRNAESIIIAAGMSDFDRNKDTAINQVFIRADREMYDRKNALKIAINKRTKEE